MRVVPIVVCDDAVVRRTLVLIAFTVAIVFVVAILHRILLYWRYRVFTCEGVEGVQGVLTLFCGGVAQTCHDDRVVELNEQLVVEEVERERSSQGECAMDGMEMTK